MIPMLLYTIGLHYLLYRQHRRQQRHEALTLGVIKVLQLLGQQLSRDPREPIDPMEPIDPTEPYN